ncbi:hypothetical protein FB451DRAFT_1449795 [Mycena latifolia]|nr:hypothetical protein FB451DRAFT_1449795 [Mycena latifolia]
MLSPRNSMPSSTTPPNLPPEVVDLVIGNLRSDPITLRTCALVNRDWLSTTRHHLYEALYLPHRNIQTFFDLLQCPRNTFVSRLRGLYAVGFQYNEIIQLWPFLPAFSYLRALHIYGKLELLAFNDDAILPPCLPYLESLGLYRAKFSSYYTLATCLLQFPSIKTLKLVDVTCTAGPVQSPKATLGLNLDALDFTLSPGIPGWLEWIDFSLGAPCLHVEFGADDRSFEDYLASQGTNLRNLTLTFQKESQLSIFSERPVLQHNTGLRFLKITRCFTIYGETNGQTHIRVAPALGRLLRDPGLAQLDHLVFTVALEAGAILEAGSSDGAELLDGIGFAGLRRIEFWGPWDTANDILGRQFKSAITALLPLQTARGVVHVGTHRFE